MKRKQLLLLTPLLLLPFFFKKEAVTPSLKVQTQKREVASISDQDIKPLKKKQDSQSLPGAVKKKFPLLQGRISSEVYSQLDKDYDVSIQRGHVLIRGVAAISSKDYLPEMGKILSNDGTFTYFQTNEAKNYIPVALARSSATLHPISSVLHIKEASAELRGTLLQEGFKEYYYHEKLKFLSLASTHAEIQGLYEDLKARGLNVQLEVIKPGPAAH